MSQAGNAEANGRKLTTADLAAAARGPGGAPPQAADNDSRADCDSRADAAETFDERNGSEAAGRTETLDPLFAPELSRSYRARWATVQSGFVDDPRRAVKQGDELVAQMMQSLAESFATERSRLEGQLGETGEASTENLRVSLRRYRSFFERLLSL